MRRATKATNVWRVAVRLCAAVALLTALAVVPAWAGESWDSGDLAALQQIKADNPLNTTLFDGIDFDYPNRNDWGNVGVTWSNFSNDMRVTGLNLSSQNLVSLDVTPFTELTKLECYNNQIPVLDVSELTKLTYLDCFKNQLTTLDVSRLTGLTWLDCGYNELTALDVSALTELTELYCVASELTTLDVSRLTELTWLDCSENELTTLDVSGLAELTQLWCGNNQLTTLDLGGLTKLTGLYCWNNQLTTLDVSGLTELTYLDCYNNQLTTLDVSGLTALEWLDCGYNELTALGVRELPELTGLWCYNNRPAGSNKAALGIVMSVDQVLWVNPHRTSRAAEWELVPGAPEGIVVISTDMTTLSIIDVGDPVTLSADVPDYGTPTDSWHVPGHTFTLTVYTSTMEAERAMAAFNASGAFGGKGEISYPAVSPDVLEAITSAVEAVDAASVAEFLLPGAFTAKPSPTAALSADVSIIMPSFNVAVPLTQGNVMPMAYTAYASAMPSGWAAMTPAQRINVLTSGDNGVRTVFAYEYVPGANEAAQPPVDLIGGDDPLLTWAEAYDDGIVTFNASGDMTIRYIATTGTEAPFVVGEFIVIPDGEPYPGQITDPAWLLTKPKAASDPDDPHKSSGGVGCATGAGAFALLTLGVALLKKRR